MNPTLERKVHLILLRIIVEQNNWDPKYFPILAEAEEARGMTEESL